jgi:hypothetical protein
VTIPISSGRIQGLVKRVQPRAVMLGRRKVNT